MSGINYIEVLLCAGALSFLLWLEWRAKPGRLGWRVAATIVAVAALAGLILPLSYRRRAAEPVKAAEAFVRPGVEEGFIRADWRRKLEMGDSLVVQGLWRGRGPVKLVLTGFGAVLDSATADSVFSLSAVPAQTGRAVYRLAAVRGRDTIEREEIPVETVRGQAMRVLILAATPDFENTFLANWLGKSGQAVAVRTAVSRDRYQVSFVNMTARPLERLTASQLAGFDVVIADETLMGSGSVEGGVLRRAVAEKGLGLIVRVDTSFVSKRPGMRTMAVDSLLRPVVASQLLGLGKVIYTGLNTTYTKEMAGQAAGYASYWADLLRFVGKRAAGREEWDWKPRVCLVGEELELSLQTSEEMPQGIAAQDGRLANIYLAEDELLGYRWRGRYWPDSAGWVAINDSNWLYVWPRGSWAAMRVGEKLKGGGGDVGREKVETVMVPKFWMYAGFLLSIFFLWVERKIF